MKFRTKPDLDVLNGASIFGPAFHLRNADAVVDTDSAKTIKETSSSVDGAPAAQIKENSQDISNSLTNSENHATDAANPANGTGATPLTTEVEQVEDVKKKPADKTDVDNDVAGTIAATSDPVTDSGTITNSGTPDGVRKAWETRRAGSPASAEYEQKEQSDHFNKLQADKNAPLAERQEAERDTREHMKNPENFAEHAEWVLNGSYGRGAQKAAHGIMAMGARGNREAGLDQLVAAYDHNSPGSHTISAWRSLEPEEKSNLSKHLKAVIDDHDKRVVSGDY